MTDNNNISNTFVTPETLDNGENGAFYHPQSKISESFSYSGEDTLPVSISRNEIVAENNEGLTNTLQTERDNQNDIPFMPVDVEETENYIYGVAHYVLRLYGPIINGQKAVVSITGIKVFFDIRVPANKDKKSFEAEINDLLTNGSDDYGKTVEMRNLEIEHIKAYPIRGYYKEKQAYLRITTPNTFQRKTALGIILKYNENIRKEFAERKRSDLNDILETASDDERNYFRKVAREYRIPLSGWALLKNYNIGRKPYNYNSPLCKHAFYLSVENFRSLEDPSILYKTYPSSAFIKDRTLVLAWDIETYSSRGPDPLPIAKHKSDSIFMICITVHWKDDPTPLKKICLVDVPTTSDSDWLTIVCGNEINLLKAFALCWQQLAPDIELTFNGSKYDWPFVVQRATQLNILDWMFARMSANPRKKTSVDGILRWNYYGGIGEPYDKDGSINNEFFPDQAFRYTTKKNDDKKSKNRSSIEIKINPESTFESSFLKVPGCVPIDVLPAFKTLFPKAKKCSLDYFLIENGIRSKVDLPKNQMRNFYESAKCGNSEETSKHMKVVANYCMVDSKRCQELMVKQNVINDYREMASIAFVSLFDSHYYAIGMKVRNLLGAEAWKKDILFTTIKTGNKKREDFPGAYVFPPIKGLENKRPVTGLDFASLYPSLIMTYNLSPEKIIVSRVEASSINETTHKIEFPSNGRTIEAWSVRHRNETDRKGVYPLVLETLLNKRNELKVRLGELAKKKEAMELVKSVKVKNNLSIPDAINNVIENTEEKKRSKMAEILLPLSDMSFEQFETIYNSICFDYKCVNTKQNALKVYMNSFYGEAGNNNSPLFFLELAGGITSAGQYNIKLVADYVRSKGFGIKYGDTDSLYLTCPENNYEKCDRAYNNGEGAISKQEYWEEMVKITISVMENLRTEVNTFLKLKSRSSFLKMAYEEVLFPVVFTGKKKYFGVEHKDVPNFESPKLFKKGIDVVKQGKTEIFKKVGNEIMREVTDIDNEKSIHEVVEDVLKKAIMESSQWKLQHFIKTDCWKPHVQNLKVQGFMKRMGITYPNKIPEPGARFEYIITKPEKDFDLHGNKIYHKKADQMEFVDVAQDLGKEVNLSYYLRDDLVGLCARFIMCDKKYEPSSDSEIMKIKDADKKYKAIDEYTYKSAEKWLEKYIDGLLGNDSEIRSDRGKAYKGAYKEAVKITREILKPKIGSAYEVLHGNWMSYEDFYISSEKLWDKIFKQVEIEIKKYAKQSKKTQPTFKMNTINNETKKQICSDFTKYFDALGELVAEYSLFFENLVYHCRYCEHTKNFEKIGLPNTMKKKEMIEKRPLLPQIILDNRETLNGIKELLDRVLGLFRVSN